MDRYDYSLPKIISHRGRPQEVVKILRNLQTLRKLVTRELSSQVVSTKSNNIKIPKRPSRSNSNSSDSKKNSNNEFDADNSDGNSNSDDQTRNRFPSYNRRDSSIKYASLS